MGLIDVQPATRAATFTTGPDLRPIQQASQGAVEALESITAHDLAQAVPFLQITRVDPGTRAPLEGAEPLNVFFQKPPEFGVAMADRTRFGERPPVSLQSFKIGTTQDYGPLVLQDVEISLVVHRPDAMFDDSDSGWVSLITPGESHVVRYGWAGSSKNELVNGDVFCERIGNTTVAIDSIKSILFTTYMYTFTIRQNGEIEILVHGKQNGDFALRKMLVADIDEAHESENFGLAELGKNPEQIKLSALTSKQTRKSLQSKMTDVINASPIIDRRRKAIRVRIIDVMNKLVAPTIARRAKQWGYDSVELLLGNFNDNVGSTTKKYGRKSMSGKSIGDFEIPVATLKNIAKNLSAKGSEVTMRNFISQLLSTAENGSAWASKAARAFGKDPVPVKPTIKIRVTDKRFKGNRILSVVVIDITQALVKFDPSDKLEPDAKTGRISRDRIRKKVIEKGIPYVTFGNALTFVQDASFEVIMNNQIQRAMIERYAQHLRTRSEITEETAAETAKLMPENFHEVWSSTLKGSINMLGNFVFDVFSYVWVDFGTPIWSGLYAVRQRTDTLTPAGFETNIELFTETTDPLNAIALLSAAQLAEEKKKKEKKRDRARRPRKKRKGRRGNEPRKSGTMDLR